MKQVPSHPGAFEADSISIEFEYFVAPVDGVDGVDILLVLGHPAESEVRVVNYVCEVVVIEKLHTVPLDVISPYCRFSEGGRFAIGEGIEGDDELVEFVAGVEVVEVGEMIPGNLGSEHVAFVPPGGRVENEAGEE